MLRQNQGIEITMTFYGHTSEIPAYLFFHKLFSHLPEHQAVPFYSEMRNRFHEEIKRHPFLRVSE